MTASSLITIVDRIALGVINVLVIVGLPLVAASMVVQSL